VNVAFIVVTILAAVATGYAASNDFTRPDWLMENMKRLNIPQSWLTTLGVLKGAGAVGLLAGLMMPKIGVVSGICLAIFFLGAIVFTLRARFFAHLTYPLVWLILVTASLALRLMTL
jgi:uncharacterized membrane protein YkgB